MKTQMRVCVVGAPGAESIVSMQPPGFGADYDIASLFEVFGLASRRDLNHTYRVWEGTIDTDANTYTTTALRGLTPGEGAALLATGSPWPAVDLPPTLDDLARQIIDWQAVTFPTVTAAASAEHLQREARELAANPADAEEAADVFLMLLSTVERAGVGLAGFRQAVADKLAKNKARTWKAPDAHGVVEHEDGNA